MANNPRIEISVVEVVDFMKLNGTFEPALSEVVQRKVAAAAARGKKINVTSRELQRAVDVFRAERGLFRAKDTEAWMKSSGITLEAIEEYLETNLLIHKLKNLLAKHSNRNRYLSSAPVQDTLREVIYQDWLKGAMK